MLTGKEKGARRRALVMACACLLMALAFSGCQSIKFYRQAAAGQYEILAHQKPIDELINSTTTDPQLKKKLELVEQLRQFAATELKLPPDGNYMNYVDLHRTYVVWSVVVAPPLSLEPKTWWFPIVGNASYRGYFSEEGASNYAAIWEKKGWDTFIGDVPTYSTLGWFHDPLLNTFIFEPDYELADTIFHELTHRRLFVAGDTDFNEAFATMVADEGVRRWFHASSKPGNYERYAQGVRREHDFVKLVLAARNDLKLVYENPRLTDAAKLKRKGEVISELRERYAELKKQWGVTKSGYDEWFSAPLNNAQLNTIAAYYDLVPAFQAMLQAEGGDLEKFYVAVEGLAKLPFEKRHAALLGFLAAKESKPR
jgi:predicted aminopeptidase